MKRLLYVMLVLAFLLAGCAKPAAEPVSEEPAEAPAAGEQPVAEAPAGEKTVIRGLFMKQAGYQESDIESITAEFEQANPDIDVQTEYVSYEALHDKIVTSSAAKSGAYDVVLVDCIWPAEFAQAGFVLDVSDKVTEEMKADIWPGALE